MSKPVVTIIDAYVLFQTFNDDKGKIVRQVLKDLNPGLGEDEYLFRMKDYVVNLFLTANYREINTTVHTAIHHLKTIYTQLKKQCPDLCVVPGSFSYCTDGIRGIIAYDNMGLYIHQADHSIHHGSIDNLRRWGPIRWDVGWLLHGLENQLNLTDTGL